jgi:hypothetical protein
MHVPGTSEPSDTPSSACHTSSRIHTPRQMSQIHKNTPQPCCLEGVILFAAAAGALSPSLGAERFFAVRPVSHMCTQCTNEHSRTFARAHLTLQTHQTRSYTHMLQCGRKWGSVKKTDLFGCEKTFWEAEIPKLLVTLIYQWVATARVWRRWHLRLKSQLLIHI